MGIKTDPHRPYCPDVAPSDFWLFPKLRGCRYETIEEMKEAVTKVIDTHTRGLPWGRPEVVGTVQVHCSRRRLVRRGQEFHVCTINKSAHTKKSGSLFNDPRSLDRNENYFITLTLWLSLVSEKSRHKNHIVCLVCLGLWHINYWRLFNAKFCFCIYTKYVISKCIVCR